MPIRNVLTFHWLILMCFHVYWHNVSLTDITVPFILIQKCKHKFLQLGYVWLSTPSANVVWTCNSTVICLVVQCTETSKLGIQFSSMSNTEAFATSVQSLSIKKRLFYDTLKLHRIHGVPYHALTSCTAWHRLLTPTDLIFLWGLLDNHHCVSKFWTHAIVNHALFGCTTPGSATKQSLYWTPLCFKQAIWKQLSHVLTCFDVPCKEFLGAKPIWNNA
jgi:hypothetical protein